jgi:alpha-tubulin suppressor-like RCC1 family protein
MALRELPLEMLTHVCQHLGLTDLVRVAATCKRFRHGGPKTVELPTDSPVVTVLRKRVFPRPELIPSMRPAGCSESWVSYLARCTRQRRCREAPPIVAGFPCSLFVDATGRLLACGIGAAVGHGDDKAFYHLTTPVAAMAGVEVQSVAAAGDVSLALTRDGLAYSWGENEFGQLGLGDTDDRPAPVLVEGLEGVCSIATDGACCFALMRSGDLLFWGRAFVLEGEEESEQETEQEMEQETEGTGNSLWPTLVAGFGDVRVCRVFVQAETAFAIGAAGELFSWGDGDHRTLGHGSRQNQPSPKRVEALRDVR